ncbi:MAG: CPBP family intramembrane metalloprotease, partial [Moorella sp. (in: Bacteria)]|nr:CPBP family intramembrane metalloprotease [Moorella sp. (in: firmicutes)]
GHPGRQFLVALCGLPLGLLEYLILRPRPLTPALAFQELWLPALILLVCTGFTEEFIFRGLLQRAAALAAGPRFALYYVSFIFAVLHITHRSVIDVIFVFAVALYFGWIVQKERSILGVTLAHGLTNITLYLIWPFLL